MAKVTAIVNQKGGVGKTTTALNLSYALSEAGKEVLLIDFDPQASLSVAFGINTEKERNINDIMADSITEKEIEDNGIINIKNNLDIIPASLDLAAMEMALVSVMSKETVLKSIIEPLKEEYDHIIIDCSPSLGTLTINALTACDSVIVPVTPEYLSTKGLLLLMDTISKVKRKINKNIKVDGILITMANQRTNLSKKMIETINERIDPIDLKYKIKTKVFKSIVPISVKTGESILMRKSIIEYDPKNKVSKAYDNFAKEWDL